MNDNDNFIPGTQIKKPTVKLIGTDGNAFALMGKVSQGLRRAGAPSDVITLFTKEAMSGDYNALLCTCTKYADVE